MALNHQDEGYPLAIQIPNCVCGRRQTSSQDVMNFSVIAARVLIFDSSLNSSDMHSNMLMRLTTRLESVVGDNSCKTKQNHTINFTQKSFSCRRVQCIKRGEVL